MNISAITTALILILLIILGAIPVTALTIVLVTLIVTVQLKAMNGFTLKVIKTVLQLAAAVRTLADRDIVAAGTTSNL
jgi:hypothetical protein